MDAGLARGTASVSIVITNAAPTSCVRQPGQTCTAAGVGTVGRQLPVAFEFTAGVRNAQADRTDAAARRELAIPHRRRPLAVDHGDRATFAGTGSLNGRPGYAFEATVADNRAAPGRGGAPDTLRVVVRDAAGTVVRVIEGEVTRGDIVVD